MSIFVVMGVSGSGKTSVARLLAEKTGGRFLDADDFHPAANQAKMAAGVPLTDADRWPWLDALNAALREPPPNPAPLFLACSALRQAYRDRLAAGVAGVRYIYLRGSPVLIQERVKARQHHFMPPDLLDSQFETLEEPDDAIVVPIDGPLAVVVDRVLSQMEEKDEG